MPDEIPTITLDEYRAALGKKPAKKAPDPTPTSAPEKSPFADKPWYNDYVDIKSKASFIDNLPENPKDRELAFASLAQNRYKGRLAEEKAGPINPLTTNPLDGKAREWGLARDTKKTLGGQYDENGNQRNNNILDTVRNVLPNVADLAYRGYQGADAAVDTVAMGLDDALSYTGLPQLLGNPKVLDTVKALEEGFPLGGAEGGIMPKFTAPLKDNLSPEIRATLNDKATELFNNGASWEDMQKFSRENGLAPYGPELDDAIVKRDAAKPKADAPPTLPDNPTMKEMASYARDKGEYDKKTASNDNPPPHDPEEVADRTYQTLLADPLTSSESVSQFMKEKYSRDVSVQDIDNDRAGVLPKTSNTTVPMEDTGVNIFADDPVEFNQPPLAANDEALSGIDKERLPAVTESFTGEGVEYPGGTSVVSRGTRKAAGVNEDYAQQPYYQAANEIAGDRIDELDDLIANETDPKKLDAYEAEQDKLMAQEKANWDSATPSNENIPEAPKEKAERELNDAADSWYQKAFGAGADDPRATRPRNTKDRKAYEKELTNSEENLLGKYRSYASTLSDDDLASFAESNSKNVTTHQREIAGILKDEQARRQPPITAPSDFVDRITNEGLGVLDTPEGNDYFNKNAPAIEAELAARADHPSAEPKLPADVSVTADGLRTFFNSDKGKAYLDKYEQAQKDREGGSSGGGGEEPPREPPRGGGEGPPPEDPIATEGPKLADRLTEALKTAGKATKEQKELYTAERRKRLDAVKAARGTTQGEEGLHAELAALKGEMPKAEFEGIRDQFSPEDVALLFEMVKNEPGLGLYGAINARIGLSKLLDGKVPTTRELDLLGKVFPKDFVKAALSKRTLFQKIMGGAVDAFNLPRALMATFDLSAPLRQGIGLIGRPEFYKAWPAMFKAFGSEKFYKGLMDSIKNHPNFELMEESGLAITDLGASLSHREEAFMSRFAEKLPIVRRSERAYNGFLVKLRADTFNTLIDKARAAGNDISKDPKAVGDLAKFINTATGRGDLGKFLNGAAPLLNGLFFSPRLIASRVTMLNPAYYVKLSPLARREAIKSLVALGGLATAVTQIAKLAGADVEADPRSSDFAKIKVGNTRYDILGGFGQYLTFGARMATNQRKTLKGDVITLGEKYGSPTRLDTAGTFATSKTSPVVSFVTDYLRGKDAVGNDFNLRNEVGSRFIPLFLQDAYQVAQEKGPVAGSLASLPGLFGVGIQTFDPNKPRTKTPKFDADGMQIISKKDFKAAGQDQTIPTISLDDYKKAMAAPKADQPVPEISAQEYLDTLTKNNTTYSNATAVGVVKDLGLVPTDKGIRSEEKQREYYNKYPGVARPGTGRHEDGRAIDIEVPSRGTKPSDIVSELMAKGFRGITIITKRHGSGPHWHIQWDSFGAPA